MVRKEVLTLLALGLAVGLPAAIGLGRFVASQLYSVEANDPRMAIATMLLLALVSAAAGFIPARRASLIDPNLLPRAE
jgi:ABC-type antimicrobial peptide transport system permease subunit